MILTGEEKTTTKQLTFKDHLIAGSSLLILTVMFIVSIILFHSIFKTSTSKYTPTTFSREYHETYHQNSNPKPHNPHREQRTPDLTSM